MRCSITCNTRPRRSTGCATACSLLPRGSGQTSHERTAARRAPYDGHQITRAHVCVVVRRKTMNTPSGRRRYEKYQLRALAFVQVLTGLASIAHADINQDGKPDLLWLNRN